MSLPRREEREISGDTFPLSASLSLVPPPPSFFRFTYPPSSLSFLRKITTWLLTLIFQHLSECDSLSFVSPHTPTSLLLLSLPPSIHPPTQHSLSQPQPPRVVCLSFPRQFNFYHVTGERQTEMEKNKNKSDSNRGRFARLSGCLSLSLCEFCDMYTTMNLQWGEVSLRADVCHSWSDIDTQAAFHSDSWGSDLIHRDRHWLRIEVCVCPFVYLCIRCHPLYMSHFSAWDTSEKALSAAITPIVFSMHAHACYC